MKALNYRAQNPSLNCAFPQNIHTRKLGEIIVFFAVYIVEFYHCNIRIFCSVHCRVSSLQHSHFLQCTLSSFITTTFAFFAVYIVEFYHCNICIFCSVHCRVLSLQHSHFLQCTLSSFITATFAFSAVYIVEFYHYNIHIFCSVHCWVLSLQHSHFLQCTFSSFITATSAFFAVYIVEFYHYNIRIFLMTKVTHEQHGHFLILEWNAPKYKKEWRSMSIFQYPSLWNWCF